MGRSELQCGPYVSGYHLAEWLVWNWWRLRWEPPTGAQASWNWDLAHRMSSIGEGYVWPNIEIASDGLLVRFVSSPSTDPHAGAFRYVGAPRLETVAVETFEEAVQRFVRIVIARLDDRGVLDTNLHRLWRDLEREQDEETSPFRRIEAMLGHDPDEGNEAEIRAQLSDADRLGRDAVAELAADAGHDERPVRADEVREDARRAGSDARVEDAARLASTDDIPAWGECQAWRVGVAMAQALRAATALNGQPVANAGLCELAGTSETAIQEQGRTTDRLSFALDDDGGRSRIALRSKWETGRRFDLARLMADRLQCLAALDPFSPDQQPSHWPRVGPVTVRSDRRQVPTGFGTTAPCPRTTPLPSGREPSSRSGPTDNLLMTSGELHERAECYCGACCSRERAISDSTA